MRLCPSCIVIYDDYTKKSTIVKTDDKEQLFKILVDKITDLKVSFHVSGGYVAGECETMITREYDETIVTYKATI